MAMSHFNESASTVNAYFHEYSDLSDDRGSLITASRFLHFLAHTQLFTSCLDHLDALEIFREAEGAAQGEGPGTLDTHGFRAATTAVARLLRGGGAGVAAGVAAEGDGAGQRRNSRSKLIEAAFGATASTASAAQGAQQRHREEQQALQALIRDIHLVRGNPFDAQIASEVQGPLYVPEVLEAIYSYSKVIRKFYLHYATNNRGEPSSSVPWESLSKPRHRDASAVSCRSAFRLVRALHLEPDVVVPAEFAALARHFVLNALGQSERTYFSDRLMIEKGQDVDWTEACPGPISDCPGEPRYDVAGLAEILAAVALTAPPRCFHEAPEVRVQRIHDIFGRRLGFPRDESARAEAFDVASYLHQLEAKAGASGAGNATSAASMRRASQAAVRNANTMGTIFAQINMELPPMPAPRGPQVAGPPPGTKLLKKPLTSEEVGEELQKLSVTPRFMKMSDKGKLNARRKVKAMGRPQFPGGAPEYGKVYWLERTVPPVATGTPRLGPMDEFLPKRGLALGLSQATMPQSARGANANAYGDPFGHAAAGPTPGALVAAAAAARPPTQREYRYEQLEQLRQDFVAKKKAAESLAAPVTGWALRMSLIDEPLLAPRCSLSEEVSTTIETALVSRRLRKYGVSIALLIRARRLWAMLLAGRQVPLPWRRVQAPVPTPSPWDRTKSERVIASASGAEGAPSPAPGGAASDAAGAAGSSLAASRSESLGGSVMEAAEQEEIDWVMPDGVAYDPHRNFELALGDCDEDLRLLPPEVGLYFSYELASLHSALREDDLAAQLLWRGRRFADALPSGHPDAAATWVGLGRIAYHAGMFEIAARTLSRARTIREKTIGGDTIETASTYNNLACCFAAMDRALEAAAHLELAVEILNSLCGDVHPRTQVAMRNLEKARSSAKHIDMELPHRFCLPMPRTQVGTRRKKPKKKKGDGASSRGSSRGSEDSKKSARGGRRKKK